MIKNEKEHESKELMASILSFRDAEDQSPEFHNTDTNDSRFSMELSILQKEGLKFDTKLINLNIY
jgi:hypothetical protein